MDTKVLESRLREIEELNRMWEASGKTLNVSEFLGEYLNRLEKYLDEAIPIYAYLLDKDELSPQEEWSLKFLQDSFVNFYGTLSALLAFMCGAKAEIPEELRKRAIDFLTFLGETTGVIAEHDKELEKAVMAGLKDAEQGRTIPLEDFFNED
ncbi:hypothetical protein JCM9492_11370 [Aquifex pyrophilus]